MAEETEERPYRIVVHLTNEDDYLEVPCTMNDRGAKEALNLARQILCSTEQSLSLKGDDGYWIAVPSRYIAYVEIFDES